MNMPELTAAAAAAATATTADITTMADTVNDTANDNGSRYNPQSPARKPSDDVSSSSSSESLLVRYRNAVYDLGAFVHKHPGGRNTLEGLGGRDIGARMRAAPPHSAAAMYLLREYRVADTTDVGAGGDGDGDTTMTDANNNLPEPPAAVADDDVKRARIGEAMDDGQQQQQQAAGDEWHAQTDDSMEVKSITLVRMFYRRAPRERRAQRGSTSRCIK